MIDGQSGEEDSMKHPAFIRFIVIIILTAFTAFYFYIENNQRNHLVEDVTILKGTNKDAKVALTFNMSWGNEKVYDILEVLRKAEIRATFFISGEWLERHQHILEIMIEDKHEIAMLGYRYTNYADNDVTEMKRDVSYAYDTFKKYDLKPSYVRAPNGVFSDEMQTYVKQFGLEPVHYSLHTHDLQAKSAQAIVKLVLGDVKKGDILLFHASDNALHTTVAVGEIVMNLRQENMEMVTLTELLNGIDVKEKVLD